MSEDARKRILLRRAKFIAAALAASAVTGQACGGTIAPGDAGDDSALDAGPSACLKMAVDSGPQPCLTPIQDDAGTKDQ